LLPNRTTAFCRMSSFLRRPLSVLQFMLENATLSYLLSFLINCCVQRKGSRKRKWLSRPKQTQKGEQSKSVGRQLLTFEQGSGRNCDLHIFLTPVFFAEAFWSFFADTFWLLKHFGYLSHGCIKTHHNSVFSLYFQTF